MSPNMRDPKFFSYVNLQLKLVQNVGIAEGNKNIEHTFFSKF